MKCELHHHDSSAAPVLERFVEAEEAAAFLHLAPRYMKNLARQGQIPAYPRGNGQRRRLLYLLSELDAWLRGRLDRPVEPSSESERDS